MQYMDAGEDADDDAIHGYTWDMGMDIGMDVGMLWTPQIDFYNEVGQLEIPARKLSSLCGCVASKERVSGWDG